MVHACGCMESGDSGVTARLMRDGQLATYQLPPAHNPCTPSIVRPCGGTGGHAVAERTTSSCCCRSVSARAAAQGDTVSGCGLDPACRSA